MYLSRRLAAGGYFLEGTLLPFKPPGTFTGFTATYPSTTGGQLVFADVGPTGISTDSQAYIAASGRMTATRVQGDAMSWYADLNLTAYERGPGPATAHVTGPFSCTVYHAPPKYAPTSPTQAPA